MKTLIAVALSLALVAPAFSADAPADPVIARVNGQPIATSQLARPLIDGYGLNILLSLVQLELAKQEGTKAKVSVTPDDVRLEREQTIERMFRDSNQRLLDKIDQAVAKNDTAEADRLRKQIKDDNQRAFKQFLETQHKTEPEFDIIMQTNAWLRKIAEPLLQGKITDEELKQAFALMYGETIECRHIQCTNVQEIQEARRRLAAGESFEKVATDLSRNEATRAIGGRIPPFSRQTQGYPENFKNAAFALQPGQVSDIVQAEGAYHLILLEKRNAPKVIKFEDVKESLRQDIYERALQVTIKQLREQMANEALKSLVVEDSVLKAQLEEKVKQRQIQDQEQIKRQIERERTGPPTQKAP